MITTTTERGPGLDPGDEEFVERVGRFHEGDGAPRTSGRMLGLRMLASGELSIDVHGCAADALRACCGAGDR